jgi:diguanylate cyclase (GGDEF)-like protein
MHARNSNHDSNTRFECREIPSVGHRLGYFALIAVAGSLAFFVWSTGTSAGNPPPSFPRHELEALALTEPDRVLAAAPSRIEEALRIGDNGEAALLWLAQANACRVKAQMDCQKTSSRMAQESALLAGNIHLEVRGLVLEASGASTQQEFVTAEELLTKAEQRLRKDPHPILLADILLNYSTMSNFLGDTSQAMEHAERGLYAIQGYDAPVIRVRLLRNKARAQAQLNDARAATSTLVDALSLIPNNEDPRLRAELLIELAKAAQSRSDGAQSREYAQQALTLSNQLDNEQLQGTAHELLAVAYDKDGDTATAYVHFEKALALFESIPLHLREERRVLRKLLHSPIAAQSGFEAFRIRVRRLVDLESSIDAEEQAQLARHFESRLEYAQQAFKMEMLQDSIEASRQRQILTNGLVALAAALTLVLATAVVLQKRSSIRLRSALQDLRVAQGELEELTRIDSLTGIANRRYFDERLASALAHARRTKRNLALLAIDLDHFKDVNDTLGHAAGDAVLREVVARVLACVRRDDFFARLGGDEFALVVEEPPAAAGEIIASKLLHAMAAPFSIEGHSLIISLSIGIAFADGALSAEVILAGADDALYEAKRAGRSTFRVKHLASPAA